MPSWLGIDLRTLYCFRSTTSRELFAELATNKRSRLASTAMWSSRLPAGPLSLMVLNDSSAGESAAREDRTASRAVLSAQPILRETWSTVMKTSLVQLQIGEWCSGN